jgi:hypothetical protein
MIPVAEFVEKLERQMFYCKDVSDRTEYQSLSRLCMKFCASVGVVSLFASPAIALESKSFVVGWFTQAHYTQDDDCPGGINPGYEEQVPRSLAELGLSEEEITSLLEAHDSDSEFKVRDLINNRARIDGKPANAYAHPAAVADPKLSTVVSDYAHGFDLDGRGDTPGTFEDPKTGEKGIDNQLFRVLGCIDAFRGTLSNAPTYSAWAWTMMKDSTPAWLITIEGENLVEDGEVTIHFNRAMEFVKSDANGKPRADMTYRASPDPRSQNAFRGEIRDGTLRISEHGVLNLLQDPLVFPEFTLHNTHLRMQMDEHGALQGILGGYQPWQPVYFAYAGGGWAVEHDILGNIPGIYHLLRRHADALPDPETGQNMAISASYYFEAVPAFVAHPSEADFESASAR